MPIDIEGLRATIENESLGAAAASIVGGMDWEPEPKITQERLKEALSYNPNTGLFTWKIRGAHRIQVGDIAGHAQNKLRNNNTNGARGIEDDDQREYQLAMDVRRGRPELEEPGIAEAEKLAGSGLAARGGAIQRETTRTLDTLPGARRERVIGAYKERGSIPVVDPNGEQHEIPINQGNNQ